MGLAVFPLHPIRPNASCGCGQKCDQPGKHPITRGWQRTICSPAAVVSSWPAHALRGIGLLCGPPSGVFAVDIDPRHGGEMSLARLEHQYGALPDTWRARTGSGGQHWIYRWPTDGPEIRNSAGKLGPGLDVRGAGGFIVLAPSLHVSGHQYAWINDPAECELARAPRWLIERVRAVGAGRSKRPAHTGAKVPGGQRHDALLSLMGLMRSWGASEPVLIAAAEAFVVHQCESDPERPLDVEKACADARWVAAHYTPNPQARTSLSHYQ